MKQEVQEKINRIRELAKSSSQPLDKKGQKFSQQSDSLSQAIRNAKEADMFLAELDAAFILARKK